jgi:hypothetical protein
MYIGQGINVATGLTTYIGLNRVFHSIQTDTIRCADDLNSFAKVNSYSFKLRAHFDQLNISVYEQQACFDLCYQDQLVDKCTCYDVRTPAINESIEYCYTTNQTVCAEEFDRRFTQSDLDQFCNGACIAKCNTLKFGYSTGLANFPSKTYLNYLTTIYPLMFPSTNSTSELFEFSKQALVRLIVSFSDIACTNVTESRAQTLEQFIGQFGGNLGLCLGMSILSFFELFELIYIYAYSFVANNCFPQQSKPKYNNIH